MAGFVLVFTGFQLNYRSIRWPFAWFSPELFGSVHHFTTTVAGSTFNWFDWRSDRHSRRSNYTIRRYIVAVYYSSHVCACVCQCKQGLPIDFSQSGQRRTSSTPLPGHKPCVIVFHWIAFGLLKMTVVVRSELLQASKISDKSKLTNGETNHFEFSTQTETQ